MIDPEAREEPTESEPRTDADADTPTEGFYPDWNGDVASPKLTWAYYMTTTQEGE